ncbi:hypothetical protein BGW38_003263 [Lunasporangiospora selenospora]|uniref:Ankyrin repeat-containing protein n=1 Tax=Lunasporangiospora selenospora TaxID=979761 RepID=A0A9P6KCU3_9FUNG|nr:hypothetical protein BGW38_003263 [Lunasporangiospora selenospora]
MTLNSCFEWILEPAAIQSLAQANAHLGTRSCPTKAFRAITIKFLANSYGPFALTAKAVKSPEPPRLKIKLKQPEQATLTDSELKKMFVAIEENDVKTMKFYLSQKNIHPDTLFETNIFEESSFTWSALHAAAYYGSKNIIPLLMEHNANVELHDTWYKGRPLAWAAFGGHIDVAKMLIDKYGADKKAENEHGQVALELVYDLTPEWEKVFSDATSRPKNKSDSSSKPSKDNKGSKPLSEAFTELYKLVLSHKDKSGRELADAFLALPSKEEYPEYYEIIKSPMSLQLVLSRIKSGHYKNVNEFDKEFQLVFENALIFNEDSSRINKDARTLLKFFNTRKKDVFAAHKLVENPKTTALDKADRVVVKAHTKGNVSYRVGEFVELSDPNRTIILIERLEADSKKSLYVAGSKFLRPHQTLQVPGQTFYEKEVLKTSGEWEYDFELVNHKVYVQAHKDYVRGKVLEFDPKDVYVCENRYSETGKSAFLIKDWKRVYTIDPLPTSVKPYPSPIKLPKFEVKSTVTADTILDNIGRFNGRRSASGANLDSRRINKRPRPPKKAKPPSKRKHSESDDDENGEDDEGDDEDEEVDVDGVTSPAQAAHRRRSSQTQRQTLQQHQQHQQHQQQQHQQQQQQPPKQQQQMPPHLQHQMHPQQQVQMPQHQLPHHMQHPQMQHHQMHQMQQMQMQQPHPGHPQQHQFPQLNPQYPQQPPYSHPMQQQSYPMQQPQHARRVSSNMNPSMMGVNPNMGANPNMLNHQQQQMLMHQQQQQQMYQQQQQGLQYPPHQMHPGMQPPQQASQQAPQQAPQHYPQQSPQPQLPQPTPGLPQSPTASVQSMGSPGSPSRMQQVPGTPMIDPRTGAAMSSTSPQPFSSADMATVYDPNVGSRKGHAMLQSIAVDAEDKSFVMSLSTDSFAHSISVQQQVSSITLIPLLANQLAPIQQQVGLTVFHNGRKLTPTGLVALPAMPQIGHQVFSIGLSPGQNTIDIWVTAPVGGLFQGGPAGGKPETQEYYVFVQKNSI